MRLDKLCSEDGWWGGEGRGRETRDWRQQHDGSSGAGGRFIDASARMTRSTTCGGCHRLYGLSCKGGRGFWVGPPRGRQVKFDFSPAKQWVENFFLGWVGLTQNTPPPRLL